MAYDIKTLLIYNRLMSWVKNCTFKFSDTACRQISVYKSKKNIAQGALVK